MSAREKEAGRRRAARKSSTSARATERKATSRRRARRDAPTEHRICYSGARFARFCFENLITLEGRRGALALEPWQLLVTSELLEIEHDAWRKLTVGDLADLEADPAAFFDRLGEWMEAQLDAGRVYGLRRHREGLLGIPKKNGKSTLGSGLALYLLMADGEEGAEVYSTASTKDQAGIVFRKAKAMVEASPRLREQLRRYRSLIEYPPLGAFYKVVSADAGGLEGINPHGVANDEVHAQKTRDLYDTLRSASIQRKQPLIFSITTAGKQVRGTIGGELYTRGAGGRPKYRNGQVVPRANKQRSFYFRWYEADRRKAIRRRPLKDEPGNLGHVRIDEIKKSNPASWLTEAKLEEEAAVERPLAIFMRYHGNAWMSVDVHWLPPGRLARCRRTARLERSRPQLITIDVGLNRDTVAITYGTPGGPGGVHRIRQLVLGVHVDMEKPPPPAHRLEPDAPLSLELVAGEVGRLILEAAAAGGRTIAIGGDPYKLEDRMQGWEASGLEVVRVDQGAPMTKAAELLYAAIGEQRFEWNDGEDGLPDGVIEAHFDNATARDVGNGRWRLDKKRSVAPMDGAVSAAMFVLLAEDEELAELGRPTFTVLA